MTATVLAKPMSAIDVHCGLGETETLRRLWPICSRRPRGRFPGEAAPSTTGQRQRCTPVVGRGLPFRICVGKLPLADPRFPEGCSRRARRTAAAGHDLPFEMPPKLQSMNSDGWPVCGEQIETRSDSTRPKAVLRRRRFSGCFRPKPQGHASQYKSDSSSDADSCPLDLLSKDTLAADPLPLIWVSR